MTRQVGIWLVVGCVSGVLAAQSAVVPSASAPPVRGGGQKKASDQQTPALPAGAIRVVNFDWHGPRVAICAEEPGPAIAHGIRSWPRTRVWVNDGSLTRQVGTEPGTCDPAWSPGGDRVAVVAPGGLWVLSSDLRTTTHLVDVRHTDQPANEFAHRTLSRPHWAPDASALAFVVSNGGTSWVEVVDARTGGTIYSSDPETYAFTWGPDSRSLNFGSRVVRLP